LPAINKEDFNLPIYEFACAEHGRFDDLVPMGQLTHACPQCSQQSVKLVSMPAKTATLWNSRWNEGLASTGFHSYSVGGQVCDKRQEEEIMKKRGFINEKDLGGDSWHETKSQAIIDDKNKLEADAARYRANLVKFDGDKVLAVSETFKAKDMLAEAEAHDSAV